MGLFIIIFLVDGPWLQAVHSRRAYLPRDPFDSGADAWHHRSSRYVCLPAGEHLLGKLQLTVSGNKLIKGIGRAKLQYRSSPAVFHVSSTGRTYVFLPLGEERHCAWEQSVLLTRKIVPNMINAIIIQARTDWPWVQRPNHLVIVFPLAGCAS